MSSKNSDFMKGHLSPELFMPASHGEIYDISNKIGVALNNSHDYEAIKTRLTGEHEDLSYAVESTLLFDDDGKQHRVYHTSYRLNDDSDLFTDSSVLKIGYAHKRKAYAKFNNVQINHKDTVNKLAFYGSHLIKLLAHSEEDIEIQNDNYLMHTAGAGHGIIKRILESDSMSALKAVHNYYDYHETSNIKDFSNKEMPEKIASWLQNHESTVVENSKKLLIELDDDTDFVIHSSRSIRNKSYEKGLDILDIKSLKYIEHKKEKKVWVENKSIELNLRQTNNALRDDIATVITHNGKTNFADEMSEIISNMNSSYGGLDNHIVKKPIRADILFFDQILNEIKEHY